MRRCVQAYRSVVLYVHRFLDACLKRDDQALAFAAAYRDAQAIRAMPRFGNAWDSEGEAWEALGDKEQAIKAYEQAVAVDKDQANAIARIKALRAGN